MNVRILTGGILMLVGSNVVAADWTIDPKVALSAIYNDNNRLTEVPAEEIKVSGARLDAQVGLRADTPTSSFLLTPRVRSSFLPGDETEEADDQFVRMFGRHTTERAESSLDVNYSRVITLGDYFPDSRVPDDEEIGDPDRGVGVGQSTQRNREVRLAVRPRFAFDVTERGSVELEVGYLDVGYDKQLSGDQIDYEDMFGALAYVHQFSQTATIAVRGAYSTYDPEGGESTDSQSLDAEWRNRISDTAEMYVRGGMDRVEIVASGGGSDWETGFTGGAGVRWAFEVTDVWVDASQNLDPNSSGDLVRRDELRAQMTRRIGPMTRVTVAARYISDSGATDDSGFTDRNYATGKLGFDWRFARAWSLFGAYDYSWREYDDRETDAKSNALSLGVVYEPRRR